MNPASPTPRQNSNLRNPPVARESRARTSRDFTHGGDLVLRSVDGQTFSVHSVLLSLASPMFADMLEIGSRSGSREVVELAETGEMVELMLRFIYPRQHPTISSFDTLQKALHVADKYQLDAMAQQLRREMLQPGSPTSLYTNPLSALSISSAFGFTVETQLALSQARIRYDFTTVDGLKRLAKDAPASIPWILLIGVPSVKQNAIVDVLFNFNKEPMKASELSLCQPCREIRRIAGKDSHSPPEWLARWAYGLSIELRKRRMEEWDTYFDVGFLFDAVGRHGGTPIPTVKGNCACLDKFSTGQSNYSGTGWLSFEQWASNVYEFLVARLDGLSELEALIR